MDIFIKPVTHYKRKIDLIQTYVNDATEYLARMTQEKDRVALKAFVLKQIQEGEHALQIPTVHLLHRGANGDRKPVEMSFDAYLASTFSRGAILAPTLTAYRPIAEKKSLLGEYITTNLAKRTKSKAAMFQAQIDNRMDAYETFSSQQQTFKIKNNALSGAQCSPFTPVWNKTGHSTLTSTCRTATSYANANNERFLAGNRHYHSPNIVKTNIISIIRHSDYALIAHAMAKYHLVYPSVEDCLACIRRSTEYYWRSEEELGKIGTLLASLTDNERAAFLYTSDLYHLAKTNEGFVRHFLDRLSAKATGPLPMEEAKAVIKAMDGNMAPFVSVLCAANLDGKGIKEALERPLDYGIVAATVKDKEGVIAEYADFIQAFWVTDNLPPSIFALPAIVRRAVLTSDTDSTIFTTQYWVRWHRGKMDFSEESIATCVSMVYIASELVKHILATLCGNMGIEEAEMFRLAMKNEFYFPVFTLTSRAKHYYAYQGAREGLVFKKMKPEIKGVALRSSAISAKIIDLAQATMCEIMDDTMAGKKTSIVHLMRKVASVEREVLTAVKKGSYTYYRRDRINTEDSYKDKENSKYQHYLLWNAVFAKKYGKAPEPPYVAFKATLNATKPKELKAWLEAIADRQIANDLEAWLEDNHKKGIGAFYLPAINLIAKGVPVEIAQAVDTRSLVAQLMESFYLVLEGFGIFVRNKKITRLLSDDESLESLPEPLLVG